MTFLSAKNARASPFVTHSEFWTGPDFPAPSRRYSTGRGRLRSRGRKIVAFSRIPSAATSTSTSRGPTAELDTIQALPTGGVSAEASPAPGTAARTTAAAADAMGSSPADARSPIVAFRLCSIISSIRRRRPAPPCPHRHPVARRRSGRMRRRPAGHSSPAMVSRGARTHAWRRPGTAP